MKSAMALKKIAPHKAPIVNEYFIHLGCDLGFSRRHMINLFTKREKYGDTTEEN
jgi:hypothetical protein